MARPNLEVPHHTQGKFCVLFSRDGGDHKIKMLNSVVILFLIYDAAKFKTMPHLAQG